MAVELGTRSLTGFKKERYQQGSDTRTHTRDKGMTKISTPASASFNVDRSVTGSNGDFANFAVGDPLLVGGTNLNNGTFAIIAIDGNNQAFLSLDPPPKTELATTATFRTP